MSLLSGVFYQKPTNQPVKPTHSVVYCCIKRRNVSPKHTIRPLGYSSQYFFPLSSSPGTPFARKVRAFTAYGIIYDTTISSKPQGREQWHSADTQLWMFEPGDTIILESL